MQKLAKFLTLALPVLVLYLIVKDYEFFDLSSQQDVSDAEIFSALDDFRAPSVDYEYLKAQKPLAEFGKKLFFDSRLSANGSVSCASCHVPSFSFTDRKPVSFGLQKGKRNAPSLVNLAWKRWFFWDGRADSIARQALGPLEANAEHGVSRGFVAKHIYYNDYDNYKLLFGAYSPELESFFEKQVHAPMDSWQALPRPKIVKVSQKIGSYSVATLGSFQLQTKLISSASRQKIAPSQLLIEQTSQTAQGMIREEHYLNYEKLPLSLQHELDQIFWNIGLALAAYQKGIYAFDSPFDRFNARAQTSKDLAASLSPSFSEKELDGLKLFIKNGCTNCHNGPLLSSEEFHNIGLAALEGRAIDLGRSLALKQLTEDTFACETRQDKQTPNCIELEFLDQENFEFVGAFKVPSLRNLTQTKPYMHDGRFQSLDEVLDHYNEPPAEPAIGHRDETIADKLNLSSEQLEQLEAFLNSLTSPVSSFYD